MANLTIFFVGPLPPPVHGFSVINSYMLEKLGKIARIVVFDTKPKYRGNYIYFFLNLLHSVKLLFIFFVTCARNKESVLYVTLSGGLRQIFDSLFIFIAKLFGLRIFVHHHSFAYLNNQPFYARLVMHLLRESVHIVLCEYMGQLLNNHYSILYKNIRLISNSVFLDVLEKNTAHKIRGDKLVLGFLSNITASKGCFTFIDLVNAANYDGLPVEGVMAGPVQSEITQLFSDAVDNSTVIKYIGPVYGYDKTEFFSKIDFLVFPTKYKNEAEPVTIWESMRAGVPIISLSRGCISGMISENVGFVIKDPSKFIPESLNVIRYFINNDSGLVKLKCAARQSFEQENFKNGNNLATLLVEISGNKNDSKSI